MPSPARPRPRADLVRSTADASAYSFMVGVGEAYVPAFVLALGLGGVAAGLVSTVPLLAGAVLQLVSPLMVARLASYKRWVVASAFLQALALVPLVVMALTGEAGAVAVFACMTLYFAFGQAAGPAWNAWMEWLVPRRVRARYFAKRARIAQVVIMLGLAVGGVILELGARYGAALFAFALVFALAAAARMLSARCLGMQSEPARLEPQRSLPLGAFVERLWHGEDGRLVLYMLALQTSVYVAAPFFAPFVLKELGFTYAEFVVYVGVAYVARIVALPLLGTWAKRHGPRAVLWLGGAGIVPLSALWVLSSNYYYLLVAQVVAGVFWGAYELSTQLCFFELIRRDERTAVLTWFNLASALALVGGSLMGGALLHRGGDGRAAYFTIFVVSFVGRALALVLLGRVAPMPRRLTRLVLGVLSVRAPEGAIGEALVPSIEERTHGPAPARRSGD